MPRAGLTFLLSLCFSVHLFANPADENALPSIDLVPQALGDSHWPISTDHEAAQALFDQGMQLRWAYNMRESARSMASARRIDPNCAICYWGEAFGLGSFLNGGMTKTNAPLAHAAITRAAELAPDHASEVERDLITAALVRYPSDYDPKKRRAVDEAFAASMAEVYQKYPDDHEVAVVYAVALFMLERRRGYRDVYDPDLQRLHKVLRGIIDDDIRHPGACHLYIHATESSQHPEWGLPCAEYLGQTVKTASHIQHMPSHTWNEVGMWGRSVEANTAAWHSDLKASQNQGFSYGAAHNLHMLLYAASYDGQSAPATQAGRDYEKITENGMYSVLTLVRFGRFDQILDHSKRPEKSDVGAALWDFAQGYASLKTGDLKTAKKMLKKVRRYTEDNDDRFRFHPASVVTGTVQNILAGEIHWQAGDLDAAIAAFEKAAVVEDKMDYDEPEPLPFAARHWLGAALLEAQRYADAEQVYRDEIKDHPNNGWSLFGLKQALAAQGKSSPAVDEDFENSWARSDTWITSSKF